MKSCHVSTCEDKDIPEGLKGQHNKEAPFYKVSQLHLIMSRRILSETVTELGLNVYIRANFSSRTELVTFSSN